MAEGHVAADAAPAITDDAWATVSGSGRFRDGRAWERADSAAQLETFHDVTAAAAGRGVGSSLHCLPRRPTPHDRGEAV